MFQADDFKTWANLFVGLALVVLGAIPLLNMIGILGFGLPGFLANIVGLIALWVIAAVGLWLLVDAFMEEDMMRIITLIGALLFLAIGIVAILEQFGFIGWAIPFLSVPVYYGIFVVEGLLLILAAFFTW